MKEHFCPAEQSVIAYEGECNWCGEREGSMTQDELIKRLETTCFGLDPIDPLRLLVDDVIEALAQTKQQELVAYWKEHAQGLQRDYDSLLADFQAQRTWVGLTRDEQSFVYSSLHNATSREDSFWVDFANAIEAKLKELNT